MFLTRTGFRKLLKRSYSGNGLKVRNDGIGYAFAGGTWAAYFLHGDIPKETLGDIISLVGELPNIGEAYVSTKEGNQMEIAPEKIVSAMDTTAKATLIKTDVVIIRNKAYRVLQDPGSLGITLVEEEKIESVVPGLVDADSDEELPDGPYLCSEMVEEIFPGSVCWKNDRMAFCTPYRYPSEGFETELVKYLEGKELWEL